MVLEHSNLLILGDRHPELFGGLRCGPTRTEQSMLPIFPEFVAGNGRATRAALSPFPCTTIARVAKAGAVVDLEEVVSLPPYPGPVCPHCRGDGKVTVYAGFGSTAIVLCGVCDGHGHIRPEVA